MSKQKRIGNRKLDPTAQTKLSEHIAEWHGLVEGGNQAYDARHYTEAELKFAAALRIAEKDTLPEELEKVEAMHHDAVYSRLAKSLNNMAALYHTQGKYSMAQDLYERCLALKERLYGDEHIETAINLQNLAALHSARRRFDQAEPLYKRALALKERLLGADHPGLVQLLSNYALLLKRVNREEEGAELEERAAKIAQSSAQAAIASEE